MSFFFHSIFLEIYILLFQRGLSIAIVSVENLIRYLMASSASDFFPSNYSIRSSDMVMCLFFSADNKWCKILFAKVIIADKLKKIANKVMLK